MDSNFQYAGAVNLAVAPFMPPNARDGSVRPLSFRTARRLVSKRRGPDRRGRNPCRRRTAPNFAWSGNGNALPGDRARRSRPGARQSLGWSEGATAGPPSAPSGNPIWSVADIDPLHGVFGGAPPTVAGGPGFWGTRHGAAITRSAPENTSPVTDPKRTEKLDQWHRQGKREIMGLMAVAVTVSQDRS